jgi:hypothetical protein
VAEVLGAQKEMQDALHQMVTIIRTPSSFSQTFGQQSSIPKVAGFMSRLGPGPILPPPSRGATTIFHQGSTNEVEFVIEGSAKVRIVTIVFSLVLQIIFRQTVIPPLLLMRKKNPPSAGRFIVLLMASSLMMVSWLICIAQVRRTHRCRSCNKKHHH